MQTDVQSPLRSKCRTFFIISESSLISHFSQLHNAQATTILISVTRNVLELHFNEVLSVLELHFNEIIRCVLFPPYHLAQPKFWEFINCYLYQYFILTAEQQSIIWIYHNIFIYFPVDGHLKCFQLLAIINQAAIRRHVKAFLRAYAFVSLKQIPRKTHHIMGWAFYLFNFIKNKTTTKKTTLPASVSKEL